MSATLEPLSAALVLGGALIGLIVVVVMLVRARRVKLPVGQRPEGAPLRSRRKGACEYCGVRLEPAAKSCSGCGAPTR